MTYRYSDIQNRLTRLTEAEEPFVLATVTRTRNATSAKAGAKAIVEPDGEIVGWLGGGCVQRALREAAALTLKEGKARLIRVKPEPGPESDADDGSDDDGGPGDAGRPDDDGQDRVQHFKSACPSGGSVEIFLEPVLPRAQLVVCGGSPITRAIADLGHWLGFAVVVAALADDQAGFEKVDHRIEGFALTDLPAARERYLVVATQGKGDKAAMAAALHVEAAYRAFVGSRAKARALKDELAAAGADAAALAGLRSPAGLDIGSVGPQEIALSVLAEITALRRAAAAPGETRDEAAAETLAVRAR